MEFNRILPIMVNPVKESDKKNHKAVIVDHEAISRFKQHNKLTKAIETLEYEMQKLSNLLTSNQKMEKELIKDIDLTSTQVALHKSRNESRDAMYHEDRLRNTKAQLAKVRANIINDTEQLSGMKKALEINKQELSGVALPDLNLESYLIQLQKDVDNFKKALKNFDENLYNIISTLTVMMRMDDDNRWADLIQSHNHLFNLVTNSDEFNPFINKINRYVNYYLDEDDE